MKQLILKFAIIAALMPSSALAFASLYSWNAAKRPPISLSDALARAEKILGDDAANRFCVSVWLLGDASGKGEDGAWNLMFAAADGSEKNVRIDMQGNGKVTLWNGPIDWKKNEGRRTGLADVRRRLEELFAKEGIEVTFTVDDGSLLAEYNIREFQVYPQFTDESYAEKLRAVPGPARDGIWLRARVVDQPDRREYDDGPYWNTVGGNYLLTQEGKFLAIDLRYGPKVKYKVIQQVLGVFGEHAPH